MSELDGVAPGATVPDMSKHHGDEPTIYVPPVEPAMLALVDRTPDAGLDQLGGGMWGVYVAMGAQHLLITPDDERHGYGWLVGLYDSQTGECVPMPEVGDWVALSGDCERAALEVPERDIDRCIAAVRAAL